LLHVDNISLKIGSFSLNNVSFKVAKGEYFAILGVSGVGKSLLLETIAGLIQPQSGRILLRGRDITRVRIQDRNISIVYQDADLFPHLTVAENIAYPLRSRQSREVEKKVMGCAQLTGISDKLNRKPASLSGGEYQRAALARSLAADSDIFLLDEPLSALDARSRSELRGLLRTLNRSGITIVHVTHDYEEAISLATQIGIMENGGLVQIDTPENVFRHPKSEFVAHFVGTKNFFRGTLRSIRGKDARRFDCNGLQLNCLTDVPDGEAYLMVPSDQITIARSKHSMSSRNQFKGKIVDIAPGRIGIEVTLDAGSPFVSTISSESLKTLGLDIGQHVWISFKASSCRLYR
jgi:molybdopterin-binding protein